MFINDYFKNKKFVYSFELFPPKETSPIETIYNALSRLKDLKPDYISITYGTQDKIVGNATVALARLVKEKYGIEPLAHLAAIHTDKKTVLEFMRQLKLYGINNILALRGDIKPELPISTDFKYASDLVSFIKENGNFGISGACYPEGHFESKSIKDDVQNLKIKIESGVTHLNTQLFYDNEDFFRFSDMLADAGITIPVQAGIMPLVKKRQVERIMGLTGSKIPSKISRMFAKFGDNEQALFDAGIAYATEQIIDLISYGIKGVHLYIMNNADTALKITENISSAIGR